MEKIIIIGNAGSGKSTFAKALASKLHLPLIHLDALYWQGNWEHLSRSEFDAVLEQALNKPQWIMDGNFNRTIAHRLQHCDTVFWLDMPTWVCLWGITKRVLTNYGKVRPDMGGNCKERFDCHKPSLYKNVLRFNKEHRKQYKSLLAAQTGKTVITFRRRKDIQKYLQGL